MLFHRQKTNLDALASQTPRDEEIERIRQLIDQALWHEQSEGLYLKVLRDNFDRLHGAVALMDPDGQPNTSPDSLLQFVVSYIRHVPDFIDAVNKIGSAHNIQAVTTPFLRIAQDFFLSPPELVDGHSGLAALLDEAYLAHRMIEEVNDHILARFGIPLAPMDMTKANLIVHSLIGEPFANDLDHAVQYSVEMLMMRGSLLDKYLISDAFQRFVGNHQQNGWEHELMEFPCLAGDLSAELFFARTHDQPKNLH